VNDRTSVFVVLFWHSIAIGIPERQLKAAASRAHSTTRAWVSIALGRYYQQAVGQAGETGGVEGYQGGGAGFSRGGGMHEIVNSAAADA
jgi:hypothetical protein